MKLKDANKTPEPGFVFFFLSPGNVETRVPVRGSASGLGQLTAMVRANFSNHKMQIPDNLAKIIENQICLRHSKPLDSCWEDGFGDTLHHSVMLPLLEKTNSIIQRVTGKQSTTLKKISGCGSCGGTKTYDAKKNNLGRAGRLNQLTR